MFQCLSVLCVNCLINVSTCVKPFLCPPWLEEQMCRCSELWSLQFTNKAFGARQHKILIVLKLLWQETTASQLTEISAWQAVNLPGQAARILTPQREAKCDLSPFESTNVRLTARWRWKNGEKSHRCTSGVCCQVFRAIKVRHLSWYPPSQLRVCSLHH